MCLAKINSQTYQTNWFYTAPIDDVALRRGDPLGLQAVAERVAEALAPGLSNRTMDARWISILCWCLRQGQCASGVYGVGRNSGFSGPQSPGKHLYPWIRPLELLWIAHAAERASGGGRGRQLPGIRPIRKWIDAGKRPDNFAFASSSYEHYRFTGAYGGYRAALRSLGGITENGAGWLPGTRGYALAEIVGSHVQVPSIYTRRPGAPPTPEKHWIGAVRWKTSEEDYFPTLLQRCDRLDADERTILRETLFTDPEADWQKHARRRRIVAEAVARSTATTRAELMSDLAASLKGEEGMGWLPHLASFSALADSGTDAMNACWSAVSNAPDRVLTVREVEGDPKAKAAIAALGRMCRRWRAQGSDAMSPQAVKLADTILSGNAEPREVLRRLIGYHVQYGGGLPWVMLDGEKVRPVARLRDGDASLYRYRLPALARLAAQCGIIGKPPALLKLAAEAELADPEDATA